MRAPNHNRKARRGKGVRCFYQLFFVDSSVTRENVEGVFHALSSTQADTGSTEPVQRSGWSASCCGIPDLSNNYATFSKAVNSKRYALASGNSGIVVKKRVSTFVMARHFSLEEGYRQAKEGKANWGDRLISPDLEPGIYIKL